MAKTGLVLLNIGTPASYEVADVKKYLKKFLMDKDVINLPYPLRWILVNAIIVPRRAPYSAANYKKVWLSEGSPLKVHTEDFAQKLQESLSSDYIVRIGMRYSDPSIENAMKDLQSLGVERILLAPLFPQEADATTGSCVKEARKSHKKLQMTVPLDVLPSFFALEEFIDPSVKSVEKSLEGHGVDHYLFSFHGLPESHVKKNAGCLENKNCCLEKNACHKPCYRAQCFATASKMAELLKLEKNQWSVSFQSRLGRAEWLKPSTDSKLEELAQTGKEKLAVLCPSFVADCIETLEEIGIGGKELFHSKGGKAFHLVSCLNDDDQWAQGFARWVQTF
jgi:ferrochelatase